MSRLTVIALALPTLLAVVTTGLWLRAVRRRVRIAGLQDADPIDLDDVLEASPVAACVTRNGTIQTMNESMGRLSGATTGVLFSDLFPPGRDRDLALSAERGESTGSDVVLTLQRGDGTQCHVSITSTSLYRRQAGVRLLWLLDHTRRLRTEREAAAAAARHRAIVQGLADSVIIIDEQGLVQSFSPSAEKTFGYSADEIVGRNVSRLMPQPDREHHDRYLRDYVKTGWATGGRETLVLTGEAQIVRPARETMAVRKDGSHFPARLMVSEVDTGRERFFVGLLSDVTEQKRHAAELKAAKEKAEEATVIIEAQKRRMQEELDVGHQIQMSMVPARFPDLAGMNLWAILRPAREVGGDFYDFFMPSGHELWMCVGDVSGKGVPAALLMAVTKTLVKAFATQGRSPADVFTLVNEELSTDNDTAMFVTAFIGQLDLTSGALRYVNAGHNPPLVRRADGRVDRYATRHGPVLGALENVAYGESADQLNPGDVLLLFTDGVVEAFDPDGGLYTERKLMDVVARGPAETAERLASAVVESVDMFAAGAEQADDLTLLALRFDHPVDVD